MDLLPLRLKSGLLLRNRRWVFGRADKFLLPHAFCSGIELVVGEQMHVHFERSGGYAGLSLGSDFDSANLSPEETSELTRLVDESCFFEQPELISTQSGADRFHYAITVDTGTQKHSIEFDEAGTPECLRPLLKWLTLAQRNAIAAQKQQSNK